MDPTAAIRELFSRHGVPFTEIEHEPVLTSADAARVRGVSPDIGAKSLLLKTAEGPFVLAVLPGSARLDVKLLAQAAGTKKVRFATPEEVEQVMFCRIGACYPVGAIIGVRTIVDPTLLGHPLIEFNIGSHSRSIAIAPADYLTAAKPEIAEIRVPA